MNDLLHDVFLWTGIIWWSVMAFFGLVFAIVGAIETLRRKGSATVTRSRDRVTNSRVARGGVPRPANASPSSSSRYSHSSRWDRW